MRFKYSLSLSLLCLITGLSGCSTAPTQVIDGRNWSNHREQVSQINHWSISGKMGYRSAEQGGSANFMWTQNKCSGTTCFFSDSKNNELNIVSWTID